MTPAPTEPAPSALFTRDGEAFVPTVLGTSPWSRASLHGGPVAALLAHVLSGLPAPGRMFPARFTLELLRPVGLEPMRIDTNVVRAGRKVQVLEARLFPARDASTPVARATLQQIHQVAVELPPRADEANGPERDRPAAPENCPRQRTSATASAASCRSPTTSS